MWVWSLAREDPLEEHMAPHSSILAWRIPWAEEPGRLQSMGLQRVGHDWATSISIIYLSIFPYIYIAIWASKVALVVKNLPVNAGDIRDVDLIPGLGKSPGGGHGNPLQYSCLKNPMDRGAWQTTVHGVTKSWTWLKRLSTQARTHRTVWWALCKVPAVTPFHRLGDWGSERVSDFPKLSQPRKAKCQTWILVYLIPSQCHACSCDILSSLKSSTAEGRSSHLVPTGVVQVVSVPSSWLAAPGTKWACF